MINFEDQLSVHQNASTPDSKQTNGNEEKEEKPKSRRGFAAMDKAKQKSIASKGGQAAHRMGVAHRFTPEEAREAGRKGGSIVSMNREHMAGIGKKGGEATRRPRQPKSNTDKS
ncbi:KGG domain-containing protein [Chitinophaga horti]|uniref:KGG domain-containing protein n=1 Tax=Chitinophaga horti TaxID=2920382 RepID=A0ABY6J668_9BACT|nr:KGG domain-containing protein [Chitinophaga horti]UYQ94087.1 KGG domain-containing protein [Chitinophaga horti]